MRTELLTFPFSGQQAASRPDADPFMSLDLYIRTSKPKRTWVGALAGLPSSPTLLHSLPAWIHALTSSLSKFIHWELLLMAVGDSTSARSACPPPVGAHYSPSLPRR